MSQKSEILIMLKEGTCTTEAISKKFGPQAVRRLRTLREEGHLIETEWLSKRNCAYRLVEFSVKVPKRSKRIDVVAAQNAPKLTKRASTRVSDLEWWDRKRTELSRMLWRV
jgi:hypothetical protein